MTSRADEDGYADRCTTCGHTGYFRREGRSIKETYQCGNCKASLRYREQARLILNHFSRGASEHLVDLVNESEFQNLKIYEPGLIGLFESSFKKCPITIPPIFGMISNLENPGKVFNVRT